MKIRDPITIFGEVLFDCFPDGTELIGGAPFNVAWHLRGFGLDPIFISRVGKDERGEKATQSMSHWGLDYSCLQFDGSNPTGQVNVNIEDNEPIYEIPANSAFDFIQVPDIRRIPASGILYHGTLALRQRQSAEALASLKSLHRGQIFMDVNLRSPWWSSESVLTLVADADHVKINENELALLAADDSEFADQTRLVASMRQFAEQHQLATLILTRGALGALLYREGEIVAVGPAPNTQVVDTVGAGDSFAAIMLLGINQQWPWSASLERAMNFAAATVSHRGAIIDDTSIYSQFMTLWGCS
jgi:fructokinase